MAPSTYRAPNVQFNQIEMHTRHHDDPGGPASATAREAETDQAASLTEAKAVETRTTVGREIDTTGPRQLQRQAVHANAAAQQAFQH